MCCTPGIHHAPMSGHHYGHSCCCSSSSHTDPRFWSKKKQIKMLEQTLEGLKEEVKDIEEHITELKKEK